MALLSGVAIHGGKVNVSINSLNQSPEINDKMCRQAQENTSELKYLQ
jgi:hypothetical protein